MSKFKFSYLKTEVLVVVLFLMCALPIRAITPRMESTRFRIDWGNMNIGAKDQTSSGYKINTTMGQTAAGQFSSSGYLVRAGFQYWHSIIPFQFSVSNTKINLGTLTAGVGSTASTTLTIYFGAAGQYQVTAEELGPLQTLTGNSIPNTSCDGGVNTCDVNNSKLWTSGSAYGFGYNMAGQDIPADFASSSYYRPFPNRLTSQTPVVIMSNTNVGKNRQSTMTFKANVSSIQPAGSYQTVINYIATPSY